MFFATPQKQSNLSPVKEYFYRTIYFDHYNHAAFFQISSLVLPLLPYLVRHSAAPIINPPKTDDKFDFPHD